MTLIEDKVYELLGGVEETEPIDLLKLPGFKPVSDTPIPRAKPVKAEPIDLLSMPGFKPVEPVEPDLSASASIPSDEAYAAWNEKEGVEIPALKPRIERGVDTDVLDSAFERTGEVPLMRKDEFSEWASDIHQKISQSPAGPHFFKHLDELRDGRMTSAEFEKKVRSEILPGSVKGGEQAKPLEPSEDAYLEGVAGTARFTGGPGQLENLDQLLPESVFGDYGRLTEKQGIQEVKERLPADVAKAKQLMEELPEEQERSRTPGLLEEGGPQNLRGEMLKRERKGRYEQRSREALEAFQKVLKDRSQLAGEMPLPKFSKMRDALDRFAFGLFQAVPGVMKWSGIAAGNVIPGVDEANAVKKAGDYMEERLLKAFPGDETRADDLISGLAGGGGSMGGFVAGGGLMGGLFKMLGMPARAARTTGVAAIGGAVEGPGGYEDAVKFGATAIQKYTAFYLRTGLGLTEALPIDRFFMRLQNRSGGRVSRMLANTQAQGFEEFLQEFGQNVGGDVIAAGLGDIFPGYDPDRKIDWDAAIKNGTIGAILGGIMGFGTSIPSRDKPPELPDIPPEIAEQEARRRMQPPPSFPVEEPPGPSAGPVTPPAPVAPQAPTVATEPEPSEGGVQPPEPEEEKPEQVASRDEAALLRGAGWIDKEIFGMDREVLDVNLEKARKQRAEPIYDDDEIQTEDAGPAAVETPGVPTRTEPDEGEPGQEGVASVEELDETGTKPVDQDAGQGDRRPVSPPEPTKEIEPEEPEPSVEQFEPEHIVDDDPDYDERMDELEAEGTAEKPVVVETAEDLEQAAAVADPDPPEGKIKAGTYQKGHAKIHGLDVTIENAKGSVRRGRGADGKAWRVKMPAAYGYIKRTEGADGDQVDVYIGDDPASKQVFVVDQNTLEGAFDEHKAIMGVGTVEEARALYIEGFSDGKGEQRIRAITEIPIDEFKEWVKSADSTKPLGRVDKPKKPPKPGTRPQLSTDEATYKGDLVPAVRVGDDLFIGDTHQSALAKAVQHFGEDSPEIRAFEALDDPMQNIGTLKGKRPSGVSKFLAGVSGDPKAIVDAMKKRRDTKPTARGPSDPELRMVKMPARRILKKAGGVDPKSPLAGELRHMGITNKSALGLFKKGGRTAVDNFVASDHDIFANIETNNGYVPQEVFFEALRDEMSGAPWRSVEEQTAIDEFKGAMRGGDEEQRTREDIIALIEENGGEADQEWVKAAMDLVTAGEAVDEAIALAAENLQVKEASDEDAIEEDAIPFGERPPESERDTGSREPIAPPRSERIPAGEEDTAEASEAVRDAGQDEGQTAVEPGAEGKPQGVLPGTEKISDAELAQRKADQRLKPKADQQQADEGLFSDDSRQVDQVDEDRKPTKPLDDIHITIKADIAGTEETATIRFTAVEALKLVDDRIAGLQQLKDCVSA